MKSSEMHNITKSEVFVGTILKSLGNFTSWLSDFKKSNAYTKLDTIAIQNWLIGYQIFITQKSSQEHLDLINIIQNSLIDYEAQIALTKNCDLLGLKNAKID